MLLLSSKWLFRDERCSGTSSIIENNTAVEKWSRPYAQPRRTHTLFLKVVHVTNHESENKEILGLCCRFLFSFSFVKVQDESGWVRFVTTDDQVASVFVGLWWWKVMDWQGTSRWRHGSSRERQLIVPRWPGASCWWTLVLPKVQRVSGECIWEFTLMCLLESDFAFGVCHKFKSEQWMESNKSHSDKVLV